MVVGEEAWKKKWKDVRYEKEDNGIAFSTKVIVTEVLRDINFITEKKKSQMGWDPNNDYTCHSSFYLEILIIAS